MRPVAHAIVEHKTTSVPLPLVPFLAWLENLESSAKDARKENIKRIVPCYQASGLHVFHDTIRYPIRASGEVPSEVGDSTPFATDVAQQVSPTVEELKPLSSADAVQ
ncbi:hypothetical protein DFJ58DRAFT_723326 [Suillus subalutaceus]|uniref:uncharacterized protein n=1 Tax=Suillus subalutaceus TaxID=48586 RepID=UPI001B860065|nr:uncharacterized protein DFJ58DRAFT_723326 [Suillus subalutaceus]KAG1869469.1 hypothetical protein DFJ58DRAFT_723326 [Suillus subalutaceus]